MGHRIRVKKTLIGHRANRSFCQLIFTHLCQYLYVPNCSPIGAECLNLSIEDNVRDNQLKIIKYNHLIANLLIFHNCYTMTEALKELETEGMQLTPELLAAFSPYRTHHTNRFGMYELRERELRPINYDVTFQME